MYKGLGAVRYISTRGEAPALNFVEVTLAGLARDGGLYVPESWPQLDAATIAGFAGRPYAEIAVEVLRPFVGEAIALADLARIAREAYGTFRHPAVAPLYQLSPGTFVLELFHGPTLAFKDLAMQLLGRVMDHVLAKRRERITVVVATSGDTGGAAVEAFRGRSQVDLVILFPNGRVSDVQRRMMTTAPDHNVHALAIEGTFDDCQAIVKGLFNNHGFRDRVQLSGVNSINFARIVAQVARHEGRKVFAFTRPGDDAAQVQATQLGAVWTGGSDERPPSELDAAILFAPVGSLVPKALRDVVKGGTVVCAGIHMSDIPAFPYEILWGERRVCSVANLTRRDGDEFIALARGIRLRTRVVTFPLGQANQALAALRDGTLAATAVLTMT